MAELGRFTWDDAVSIVAPQVHTADASMTRTRVSIPTQLREAGHELEATTYDGMIHYIVDGVEMDLREAADKYLGGWDNAFGSDGSQAR